MYTPPPPPLQFCHFDCSELPPSVLVALRACEEDMLWRCRYCIQAAADEDREIAEAERLRLSAVSNLTFDDPLSPASPTSPVTSGPSTPAEAVGSGEQLVATGAGEPAGGVSEAGCGEGSTARRSGRPRRGPIKFDEYVSDSEVEEDGPVSGARKLHIARAKELYVW